MAACRGSREAGQPGRSIVGVLFVAGNEPFSRLSLETSDGVIRAIQQDTSAVYSQLWKLQGQKVRVWQRQAVTSSDSLSLLIERFDLVKDH
jgi:hypothetical protein